MVLIPNPSLDRPQSQSLTRRPHPARDSRVTEEAQLVLKQRNITYMILLMRAYAYARRSGRGAACARSRRLQRPNRWPRPPAERRSSRPVPRPRSPIQSVLGAPYASRRSRSSDAAPACSRTRQRTKAGGTPPRPARRTRPCTLTTVRAVAGRAASPDARNRPASRALGNGQE